MSDTLASIQQIGTVTVPEKSTRNEALSSVSRSSNTLPPSYNYHTSPIKEVRTPIYQQVLKLSCRILKVFSQVLTLKIIFQNGKAQLSTFQPRPLPRSQSYTGNNLYVKSAESLPRFQTGAAGGVAGRLMKTSSVSILKDSSTQCDTRNSKSLFIYGSKVIKFWCRKISISVFQSSSESNLVRTPVPDYNISPKPLDMHRGEGDGAVLPDDTRIGTE